MINYLLCCRIQFKTKTMKYRLLFVFVYLFPFYYFTKAQVSPFIISGPMIGHTELRTAKIWMQFSPAVNEGHLRYNNKVTPGKIKFAPFQLSRGEFNTAVVNLNGLEPGNTYEYSVFVNNQKTPVASGEVTTQQLWQWRTPPPDFSFITGSCAYMNQPEYDRPGKPYGLDSSIFEAMAKEKSSFNLWLGDNWYTRESDFSSDWGLYYRPSRDRGLPVFQHLLKAMPQYAIWDDHDYGPNDADKSYIFKKTSRDVFAKYWCNPSYGANDNGIYTQIIWNDVAIFMLDDRWWRSDDELPDSVNGKPNANKKMFGDEQMEWLKNALLFSTKNRNISFRIIANGSQMLNPISPYDCLKHFPTEYNDLINFITEEKINGVIFLSGDRHHSEIIKSERINNYPLYDVTVSPFTSTIAPASGSEKNNPFRVGAEIDAQNYARFSFSGIGKDRKLTVEFLNVSGKILGNWSIALKDISNVK